MYSIFKLLIIDVLLCFAFVANGDVDNEIRSEEEKRHNITLTQYIKAALSGGLKSLFPVVSDYERIEAEKTIADVFPIGDPTRPLPDNVDSIETILCRNHRERGVKVLAYTRKRWPTALITQISVRLGIISISDKNDEYCRDSTSRSIYMTNATEINKQSVKISAARNKLIDDYMVLIYGNSSVNKLAGVCCAIWKFKLQLVKAMQTPETKHFVNDYFDGYNGKAVKYLCVYHSEGSMACAELVIPPPPTNIPRFTSTYSAGLELLSKITTISA